MFSDASCDFGPDPSIETSIFLPSDLYRVSLFLLWDMVRATQGGIIYENRLQP